MRIAVAATIGVLTLAGSGHAFSQDFAAQDPGGTFAVRGSIGVLALESREYVFWGDSSDYMSLLIWQSAAPLLTTSFDVKLPENWTFKSTANVAVLGTSYMEDYDWLIPFEGSPDMSNWSDRSRHPNTALDWYYNGSMQVGYDIQAAADVTININAGFEYTDVQWTATGGEFLYSRNGGFRDTVGTHPSVPGLTYRQQFPALFAGVDTAFKADDYWTFHLGAKAGVTFSARATDDHWLKDTRFADEVYSAPVLGMNAGVDYAIADRVDFFLSGKIEKVFLGRADSTMIHIPTGFRVAPSLNTSGADLLSGTITAGLKAHF